MSFRNLIVIADPADPRIAGYRDIRERDLVGRSGRFVAEGTVVLRLLVETHARGGDFAAQSILLLENRVDGLADLLAAVPEAVPVYVVSRAIMNAIAGFDIHRGVLALGERRHVATTASILAGLPASALVIAACGIANHDNIGAIFRNAAAFGADAVLLDQTCCDPLYRKALRVSVGSVLQVPYAREGSIETMLATLSEGGFQLWGLSPSGSTDIREISPAPRIALVTGTEGEGLPQTILEAIRTASIPQSPRLDSLNAGTATGIALFAMSSAMGRI
ncbi:MAG: RNA methyltransferase [Rhizobium sp.]|nr:RNA methyltransferase [Rhizobium sp.]